MLAALHMHFVTNPFKAADVIAVHKRVMEHTRSPHLRPAPPTPAEQAVHEALDEALGAREANVKIFGYWARRVRGSRTGGFLLETHQNPATQRYHCSKDLAAVTAGKYGKYLALTRGSNKNVIH